MISRNKCRWVWAGLLAAAGLAGAGPASAPAGHGDEDFKEHAELLRAGVPAGFTVVVEKPFVIASNAPAEKVNGDYVKTVRWTVAHIKKDYFANDPADILDIYLFTDKDSYLKYAKDLVDETPETPYGFFSPAHKAIVVNMETGGGTLVHEIVHPYMAANFPKCPTWFNEGLASLYEQSIEKDGHIWGLPNWRLTDLKETLSGTGPKEEGTAPSFKDLCAMDPATFYGPHRGPNYGVARYLCLYLQEQGVLPQFYKDFVKNQKTDPTGYQTLQATLAKLGERDSDAFRKKWEKWVMGLKYP